MEKLSKIKVLFVLLFSSLTGVLGVLAIPIYLMILCNIVDYITAFFAAPKRGQSINSDIGIKGIIKKVMMWLLVVVGCVVDALLKYSAETVGINLPFTFLVACIVALWICWNEIISILENIKDIVGEENMPPFLMPLIKNLKSQTEKKINIDTTTIEGE
ncbi:MAG: phage holin family protein [Lachnotalea sp.]